MSDATIGQIYAAILRLETQLSGVHTALSQEHQDILCDTSAARAATQLLTSTFAGVTASIQVLNDLVTALQTSVGGIPTADNSDNVSSIETTLSEMNSVIGNMNAALVAFDPVIISDLTIQLDELTDRIGAVPTNTSLWDYLQGVTNVDSGDDDGTVRTKVTGSVAGSDGSSICNALVEILDSAGTVVGQTNTGTDGSWTIVVDSGASYCLQVTVEGYNPYTTTFTIPAGTTAYTIS